MKLQVIFKESNEQKLRFWQQHHELLPEDKVLSAYIGRTDLFYASWTGGLVALFFRVSILLLAHC